jgi:hypothetical protein
MVTVARFRHLRIALKIDIIKLGHESADESIRVKRID